MAAMMMTLNCNGKGKSPVRYQQIGEAIGKYKPSILFLQETSNRKQIHTICGNNYGDGNDLFAGGNECGYCYFSTGTECGLVIDSKILSAHEFVGPSEKTNLLDELVKKNVLLQNTEFEIGRMCAMLITVRNNAKCLCISWHGKNNGMKEEARKALFQDLVSFVDSLAKNLEIANVIIGGDFNFELDSAISCLSDEDFCRTLSLKYAATEYHNKKRPSKDLRPHVYDYFVMTTLNDVCEYVVPLWHQDEPRPLDHLPVIAKLPTLFLEESNDDSNLNEAKCNGSDKYGESNVGADPSVMVLADHFDPCVNHRKKSKECVDQFGNNISETTKRVFGHSDFLPLENKEESPIADTTLARYQSYWDKFVDFCQDRGVNVLKAGKEDVHDFIFNSSHVKSVLKPSTLREYKAAIQYGLKNAQPKN